VRLQQIKRIEGYTLPQFDKALMLREMKLFTDWFLKGKLGLTLSPAEQDLIEHTFNIIADRIERQPYLCVHRDYHARNLMLLDDAQIGILDFQDAVWGPMTYDIISLLKDCYVVWPRDKVVDLVGYYHQLASAAGVIPSQTFTDFLRDFDWMGIQRHIKVIGIFSRLNLRDKKSGYLKDIPVAMQYLTDALGQFGEFAHFNNWMQARVMPIYQEVWSLANV
jgi:aminoglycoside/choline kinase family phosphotransferase